MNMNDVAAAVNAIKGAFSGLIGGTFSIMSVPGIVSACKRLTGQKGAAKEVTQQLVKALVEEHPELIDVAFAGLSEVAKNRIRRALDTPEVKEAERA